VEFCGLTRVGDTYPIIYFPYLGLLCCWDFKGVCVCVCGCLNGGEVSLLLPSPHTALFECGSVGSQELVAMDFLIGTLHPCADWVAADSHTGTASVYMVLGLSSGLG
jgi:hypothetical protein